MGRQREIIVGGRSRKIDLLFYHVRLRCYIACEIKVKPFEPEFTGKLNYYVSAVDELLKAPDDNPTIGLLICSDMDKTDVQWSFRGITTPMGGGNIQQHPYQRYAANPRAIERTDGTATEGTQSYKATDEKSKRIIGNVFGEFKRIVFYLIAQTAFKQRKAENSCKVTKKACKEQRILED